jgi:hypothetical protein
MQMAYCPTTHPVNTVITRKNVQTRNPKTALKSARFRRGDSIRRTKTEIKNGANVRHKK